LSQLANKNGMHLSDVYASAGVVCVHLPQVYAMAQISFSSFFLLLLSQVPTRLSNTVNTSAVSGPRDRRTE